jgi:hypothetical protein
MHIEPPHFQAGLELILLQCQQNGTESAFHVKNESTRFQKIKTLETQQKNMQTWVKNN